MATVKPANENTLVVRRTIKSDRQKVFDAWVTARTLKQWFSPSDEFATVLAEADARVGGGYRIEMQSSDGKVHAVTGTYKEVERPARLVFTWRWEKDAKDIGETLVTLEFLALGDSTELILTHEGFPETRARDRHAWGHEGVLDRLAALLS